MQLREKVEVYNSIGGTIFCDELKKIAITRTKIGKYPDMSIPIATFLNKNCSIRLILPHFMAISSKKTKEAHVPAPIFIKGAKLHNLKNIDVSIPRQQLVVITGVSGSGKSSLTIDTLYAEGQRKYVESLSAYARQFLSRMSKPEVEYITGLCPAIAIEQRVPNQSSRSTVGSLTEIYDYLRLLYARIGRTYSPISGLEVKKHSVQDVVDFTLKLPLGTAVQILSPVTHKPKRSTLEELDLLMQKGFNRVMTEGRTVKIEDWMGELKKKDVKPFMLVIDRLVIEEHSDELIHRIADSVQTAFFEGEGNCFLDLPNDKQQHFSNRFELDGISFDEPNPQFFNFNNSYGACSKCEGSGHIIGIDPDLVFPNKNLSVYEGAIAPWKGEKMSAYHTKMLRNSKNFEFPIHRPIRDLNEEELELLWKGNQYFTGLNEFFRLVEEEAYKIQYRVMLARYRGRTNCNECKGARVRKEALNVKIAGKSISHLLMMPVKELKIFFDQLDLTGNEFKIAKRILLEIQNRVNYLVQVGLGYLTLNRRAGTLSGGETQRIHLTRSLGSNLTSSLYILDEPSIGLHSRDTENMIIVLKYLRDMGNTVVIVEHDEDIIRQADYLIDIGPLAGVHGGELIYAGDSKGIEKETKSLTCQYLTGKMKINLPAVRRKMANKIVIKSARLNNLKDVTATFPLNALTVVTGVSGSGKTSLVKGVIYPSLSRYLSMNEKVNNLCELDGDLKRIDAIELVDQDPLGRSTRSNPVTYIKAYDNIRELFGNQQLSKINGFTARHFSFNVESGRCETCEGEGVVRVEMQFLADVTLLCDDCNGHRFKKEVLEVKFNGKNIYDVLNLTVDEAIHFFDTHPEIANRLKPLADVGLGYIKLGQSSSTLSGGEAQRVKLASFLVKGSTASKVLFIFDEPTTGLHFHDIEKLLHAMNALIENGHSVMVIEHNLEIIKCADYVIDIGPEAGEEGGYILYQGVPEGLVKIPNSHTGKYLKDKLKK